jgi:hypothetical protein
MKTMMDRVATNSAQFQEAFKMANQARVAGDDRRANAILLASYNKLYPDGNQMGLVGDKIVRIGQDGKPGEEVPSDQIWKMAEQVVDPQVFAESYIGQYTKNKLHNQEILANPEVIPGPGGKIALRLAGLVDKETGEVQPTQYIVDGITRDEAWAQQNGFKTLEQQGAELDVDKGKADLRSKRADATVKEFGVSTMKEDYADEKAKQRADLGIANANNALKNLEVANYGADRALSKKLTKSQIHFNMQRQEGTDLTNANKTTPFIGLDGKEVRVSNTEAAQLEKDAKAASENWGMGINEVSPQHVFTFNQLVDRSPGLKKAIRDLPNMKDKAARAEVEQAISAFMVENDLDVLTNNLDELHTIISKRGSTNE